jgi:hypothetical protein
MDIVLISNEEEYENICQKLTESTIENYETTPLNSKERSKIYEIMKKYPSLETKTTSIGVTGLKQIIIRRKKSDEKKTIDSLAIKLFCEYMKIPFPTFNPKYVDYYLELMDIYYDCKRKWKIYLEVLEKQNPSSIKNEINTVCAKIIEHIKTSEEYNNFISEEHKIPNIKIGNEVYGRWNNTNKWTSGIFKGETENGFEVYDFSIEKPDHIEYYAEISEDGYGGSKIYTSTKFKDRNYKNYHFSHSKDEYANGGWILMDGDTEIKIGEYETESEARKMMYEYDGDSVIVEKSKWNKYADGGLTYQINIENKTDDDNYQIELEKIKLINEKTNFC